MLVFSLFGCICGLTCYLGVWTIRVEVVIL
jgi:hypothetical protein